MNVLRLFVLLAMLGLASCSSTSKEFFRITSNPPQCNIDIDGVYYGQTGDFENRVAGGTDNVQLTFKGGRSVRVDARKAGYQSAGVLVWPDSPRDILFVLNPDLSDKLITALQDIKRQLENLRQALDRVNQEKVR